MFPARIAAAACILLSAADDTFPQAEGTIFWTCKAGSVMFAAPTIARDETIYVAPALTENGPSKLTALDRNGQKKWDFEVEGIVLSAPALGEDGTIYFGTGGRLLQSDLRGKLYALNPNGTKKWEYAPEVFQGQAPRVSATPGISSDGSIYFGSYVFTNASGGGRGKFFALESDGTKKWEFSTSEKLYYAPAIGSDGTIYIGSVGQKVYALSQLGTKLWELPLPYAGAPAIGADGVVYVPTFEGLYAVHPDGSVLWKAFNGAITPPVIGLDGTIYCHVNGAPGSGLYAIAPDGFERWNWPWNAYGSGTVAADGTIYLPDNGRFYAVYPNGFLKWERGTISSGGGVFAAGALRDDGVLITCHQSGTVYAIKGSCGLANTPWPVEGRNNRRIGRTSLGDPVRPCMTPLRLARDRGFQFTIVGEAGKSYSVDVADELGIWSTLTNVTFTRPAEHFIDPQATNISRRFYRTIGRSD